MSCDPFISGAGTYTYCHESLGQQKWNDHFIISKNLSPRTKDHTVLDEHDNTSDHLPLIFSLSLPLNAQSKAESLDEKPAKLRWDKLSDDHLRLYANQLDAQCSQSSPISSLNCTRKCHCNNLSCHEVIQDEYDSILSCLTQAATSLPRHKPGVEKDWWTQNLTDLRNQSMDIHRRWTSMGKPRHGPINQERIRIKALYKKAIRDAQKRPKKEAWNRLHTAMVSNDTDKFWPSWRVLYSKNKSAFPPVVDGLTSKTAIANSFRQHFEKNAQPNNSRKVAELDEKFHSAYSNLNEFHQASCECSKFTASIENIIDATLCLKGGKSADDDGIMAEHFLNAPFSVFVRLKNLFNAMLAHSFVPR